MYVYTYLAPTDRTNSFIWETCLHMLEFLFVVHNNIYLFVILGPSFTYIWTYP